MTVRLLITMSALGIGGAALGQSLFQRPVETPPPGAAAIDPAEPLYGVSLYAIQPPEPRVFQANDLVTIIVSESSSMKRDQSLETEKQFDLEAARLEFPELFKFFLLGGDPTELAEIGLGFDSDYEGEGAYERRDVIQARITARVLEVKPNGSLLLEARSSIQTDEEVQTMVISGLCRTEDVTPLNTVQSSQLFDLRLESHNEGQVRGAAKKGVFTRALETLFNF